jgi:hypothetical protein
MIAGGIGQGLLQGVNSYNDARRINLEESSLARKMAADEARMRHELAKAEREEKFKNAGLLMKAQKDGFAFDPESGTVTETPEGKRAREVELGYKGAATELMRKRALMKGLESSTRFGGPGTTPTASTGLLGQPGRAPQEDAGPNYDRKELLKYQQLVRQGSRDLEPIIANAKTIDKFTTLAKTNPMTAAALPVMLARAVGEKGPLSNFDVQMWGGSKAVISRLNRSASLMATGTLPEEDLKFIQEIASGLGGAAEERKNSLENDIANKFHVNYGGNPDWAYKMVTGRQREVKPPKEQDRQYSKSRNQTKIIYDNGTEELIDGKVLK